MTAKQRLEAFLKHKQTIEGMIINLKRGNRIKMRIDAVYESNKNNGLLINRNYSDVFHQFLGTPNNEIFREIAHACLETCKRDIEQLRIEARKEAMDTLRFADEAGKE